MFGKSAYVLSPPTLDYHLLDLLVDKMSLEVIDGTATAIGDAVVLRDLGILVLFGVVMAAGAMASIRREVA